MVILAINFNHDGAAVVLRDGEIAGYVNTERFSRRKKHPGVRECDLHELLDQAGATMADVDLVQLLNLNVMDAPEIPRLHGSDLKETWPDFWIDKTFTRVRLLGETVPCVMPREHHLYHAALAYLFSPFDSAAVFACDPVGAQAFFFAGGRRRPAPRARRFTAQSVYTSIGERVFGSALMGAGKLMGLAPYGAGDGHRVDYAALSRMTPPMAVEMLVKTTARDPIMVEDGEHRYNASLAYHAQAFLEYEMSRLFAELTDDCTAMGIDANLCLSGGTALNCTANQRCFERSAFRQLYLHPACGDDGTAIGAALAHWHLDMGQPKRPRSRRDAMYSRRTYSATCVEAAIRQQGGRIAVRTGPDYLRETARLLAEGRAVGWFQGASEIGPRALGNRSILADPRRPDMKDHLNYAVKQREGFRPFAPSVLHEHAPEWFGVDDSPFMLRSGTVRKPTVPAVTHVDGTSRLQTVCAQDNEAFHQLITEFHALTGVPMVLNTSFNGKAEPIVETPADALACLFHARLDAVVFPQCIVTPLARPSRS
jgi:carbamoyltransferase